MKTSTPAGLLLLLTLALSCDDKEEDFAPIAGKWRGTLAEIELRPFGVPIPFSRDDKSFDTAIEFQADGKLIVHERSQTTEGTWELRGDQLVTDADFSTGVIDVSGTYTVEVLTPSTLVFFLKKKNQTITDPDTGKKISGNIKATLHFEKI